MNDNIQVNAIYSEERSPEAPYGVEVLIDCDENNPDQGSSEMSWYTTEQAQMAYYDMKLKELTTGNPPTPTKFYYSKSTATLYFLEGDMLAGVPQFSNSTFDMSESFIVEEHNKELAEEHIHAPETENFEQLGDVWAKARKALS